MPRQPSRSTLALVGAGLVLLVACLAWFVPYLTRERETVSGVPVPPPFFALEGVGLKARMQACLDEIAFDTDSEIIELTALADRRPGPPLALVATAEGYQAQASIDGGYDRPTPLRAEIEPPERSVIGELCVRNRGDRAVGLLSTSDARTTSLRSTTRVRGEPIVQDVSVRLLANDSGTVLERAGEMVERAAAFKPRLLGTPLLWLVLVLVAAGVAGGALYALASSFRASD